MQAKGSVPSHRHGPRAKVFACDAGSKAVSMSEASLLFVRDDRVVAEKLARALEGHGVSVCASASAYEGMEGYDAVIALFSGSAVRSALLMEMALAAEAEGKLVPVFVGLCHLQAPLNRLALHDLCEWNGDPNAVALQAIRANVARIARARAAGETLRSEMRGPVIGEPELAPQVPRPAPSPQSASSVWNEAAALAERNLEQRQRHSEEALLRERERERQERETIHRQVEDAAERERSEKERALAEAASRERAHRERELAARRTPAAAAAASRRGAEDLGDPFGVSLRDFQVADDFEDNVGLRFGLNEWASDVLLMTAVSVGAIIAFISATQPAAIIEVVSGLSQEIQALVRQVSG
jgi:hypothetical protein